MAENYRIVRASERCLVSVEYKNRILDGTEEVSVELILDYSRNKVSIKPLQGRDSFLFRESMDLEKWEAVIEAISKALDLARKKMLNNGQDFDCR